MNKPPLVVAKPEDQESLDGEDEEDGGIFIVGSGKHRTVYDLSCHLYGELRLQRSCAELITSVNYSNN